MRWCLSIWIFSFSCCCFSQNSAEKLNQTKQKTLQEIEYASKLLEETRGQTKQSLNEINLINHKLAKRKEYLMGLEVEVTVISESITKNEQEIVNTEKEIEKVKRIYAMMVTNLFKHKMSGYMAMYLISSEDLNQLYKRMHAVKIYNNYLKNEKAKMDLLKADLIKKNAELTNLKTSKDVIVRKTVSETSRIQHEMNEKSKLVVQLKQKQKQIEAEIREKEKTARRLENELRKLIEEERKKIKATGSKETITPEDRIISTDFEKNTGKLPWPTQRGIITGKYGEHQHPDYKNVTIRNDGVYISTAAGENARAIFKGVVSRVFQIPGQNYTVIIKHGKYFSLYHNLENVKVKPGQAVDTRQVIGTVSTDSGTKETVLYFQIWKDTERSDPELWLAPL